MGKVLSEAVGFIIAFGVSLAISGIICGMVSDILLGLPYGFWKFFIPRRSGDASRWPSRETVEKALPLTGGSQRHIFEKALLFGLHIGIMACYILARVAR